MSKPMSEWSNRQLGDEARRLSGNPQATLEDEEALGDECERRGLELHVEGLKLTVRRVTIEEF